MCACACQASEVQYVYDLLMLRRVYLVPLAQSSSTTAPLAVSALACVESLLGACRSSQARLFEFAQAGWVNGGPATALQPCLADIVATHTTYVRWYCDHADTLVAEADPDSGTHQPEASLACAGSACRALHWRPVFRV